MLHHMIWAGLKPYRDPKLSPFTKVNGRFDTIDKLFGTAADMETTPRNCNKKQL
jgi:hypothetical protein